MKVSIVVVTYNEEKNIKDCLFSLISMDYPQECYEVLVVDGCSNDKTADIVRELMAGDTRIKLFFNPERTIATNRNMGIRKAKYNLIAFTDADCIVPRNWLAALVQTYYSFQNECSSVAAVGGSNIAPANDTNRFRQALGIMLNTFLGSLGSVQGKIYSKPKCVRSLACLNVMYDKRKLYDVGLFDADMGNQGEDAELNFRLRENGYKLLFSPDIVVIHKLRPTPKAWARNMFNYGRGRIVLFRKHKALLSFCYMLPFFFVGFFALIPLGFFINKIFLLPLLYFPFYLIYSLYLSLKEHRIDLAIWIFVAFFLTYWSYSMGMIVAFLSGIKKVSW